MSDGYVVRVRYPQRPWPTTMEMYRQADKQQEHNALRRADKMSETGEQKLAELRELLASGSATDGEMKTFCLWVVDSFARAHDHGGKLEDRMDAFESALAPHQRDVAVLQLQIDALTARLDDVDKQARSAGMLHKDVINLGFQITEGALVALAARLGALEKEVKAQFVLLALLGKESE